MKRKFRKENLITLLLILVLTISVHFFLGFTSSKLPDDLWKLLGVSQQDGTEKIKASFTSGYAQVYGLRNIKNIALGKRPEVAKDLLGYARKYVNGQDFKNYYLQHRLQLKPAAPPANPKSKEEIRKELISNLEKSIKESEESMKTLPADLKQIFLESISQSKKQIEQYRQPDHSMINMIAEQEILAHQEKKIRFETETQLWKTNYPEEVNLLIKKRLQQFVDLGSTVDFEADLVDVNGKKKFVKAEYESKPSDWKAIFRAGKDVYQASLLVISDWMKEL